jgi:putative ABC transport system ATP-binding protein
MSVPAARSPGSKAAVLEARGVVRTFQRGDEAVHALRGVDLAVAPGEFVAITGPWGAGKSTLLHLFGGLDRADAGDVFVEGRNISSLSDKEVTLWRRRRAGFVFQFFHLLPTLPAVENVALPLMLDGVTDAFARALRALDAFGLAGRADHLPRQLSGGEQQRVALARALVVEPAVVLADEPTGNVDSLAGEGILTTLRGLADDGQTIVMVTHDHRWAAYADRVVRVTDGAIEL